MKEHLRERGIWYPIGVAIGLALILPGLYGELGWSLGFVLATMTVIGIGIGACLAVFTLWMVLARASQRARGVRR